ncbi:MAG TPA: sulfite exporter TauE/SafE family protein [Alphaproteobacteria bacterium]|jgi:uncharacterized membrane protein YfcA|nr:sulfite exporter TauE/SafE family protein [Alphaproteobacteria bacterium]
MQIYLPIAELSVNVFIFLGMGVGVGFLSGVFGVGGGFLMTPLLIFAGIPPAVAVATQANQNIASSMSGVLAHWRRGNVDLKMGIVLLIGGFIGSSLGVFVFGLLRRLGQVDLMISASYVLFLGTIGGLMLIEGVGAMLRRGRSGVRRRKLHQHTWLHGLPFKMRFRRSKLYISALLPLGIGVLVGILAALMGVGGGFVMIPAMIYLLGMPTSIVVGTSLFQIIFVVANVTFLQAWHNQTVDIVLALVLLSGSVVGAQLGSRFGARLQAEQLRALLGLLVVAVCLKLGYDLMATPVDPYSVGILVGG